MASKPVEKADKPPGDIKPIRKIGRPTNYKPEYCDRVVELGAKGYSQAMIIADIGAGSRETIDNWKKAHPEFLDAMTRARDLALAWWERKGLENTGNRDFNSNLYRVIMMARFGQDGYREKQVIETVRASRSSTWRSSARTEREALALLLSKAKIAEPAVPQALPKTVKPIDDTPGTADPGRSVH